MIISLLLRTRRRTVQKGQSKSQCCGKNFIFKDIYRIILRIIYQDYNSSFKELLSKDSFLTKMFKSNAKSQSHFAF